MFKIAPLILFLASLVASSSAAFVNQNYHVRNYLMSDLASKSTPNESNSKSFEDLKPRHLNDKRSHFTKLGINSEMISNIFSYLPSRDIYVTSSVCAEFYNIANGIILSKISKIIPYIPEDRCMTLAFIKFLVAHGFETDFSPDSLEMLTFNYVTENFDSGLSKNLNWHILSYFHEFFYGPDAIVPETRLDWRLSFVSKLQKGVFKFDQTLDFYINTLVDQILTENDKFPNEFSENCQTMLSNFANRPADFDLFQNCSYFDLFLLNIEEKVRFREIYFGLFVWVIPHVVNFELMAIIAIDFMFSNKTFSQSFWDHVAELDDLLLPHFDNRSTRTNYRWNKELVKKFLGPSVNGLEYLLTRDSLNPFDLQVLLAMEIDMTVLMREFLYCATPNMTEIEIFTQVVNAGLFPLELVNQAKSHTCNIFSRILDSDL